MIKRLKRTTRVAAVKVLWRTGQLDRALAVRQRVRRAVNARRSAAAQRSLNASLTALDQSLRQYAPDRSDVTTAVVGSARHPKAVIARVRQSNRVADAIRSNRDLVTDALDSIGVPYQPLPVDSPNRDRIAVPESARTDLLAALAATDITLHLYIDRSRIHRSDRIVPLLRANLQLVGQRASAATVWRVFEYLASPSGTDVLGHLHGCEVEFWVEVDGNLRSARWNEEVTELPTRAFGAPRPSPLPLISRVAFPIDVVYTWVDGDDPEWQARRDAAAGLDHSTERHEESASEARFASRDELMYSLRSVEKFADFVRRVYIVTDQQRPPWLVDDNDRIRVVDHSEIFPDDSFLPTFNSHAIESRLHHIDGLSEHYVYLNDDFLFGRRVLPELFFTSSALGRHFLSRALIPAGTPSVLNKPVDAAAMNGRALIQDVFRTTPTRKFKHAPYSQLRSVHLEIESLFPTEVRRTTNSRFRHVDDLAMASSLHHHVAYLTGKSVPGSIAARYVDLGQSNLEARLDRLLEKQDFDSLCLNDSDLDGTVADQKTAALGEFLSAYLPDKSEFER